MRIFVTLDYEGWFAEFAKSSKGISRRGKRILLVEANRKAVSFWHRKIIPRHFESNARSRYHYQRRKKRYRGIKQALAVGEDVFINGRRLPPESIVKGGRVDVVRSGRTERKAERVVPIYSTPRQAVAVLRVPKHIASRPRAGRPNMAAEITKTTKGERSEIMDVWSKTFLNGVRIYGKSIVRVRRRISGGSL